MNDFLLFIIITSAVFLVSLLYIRIREKRCPQCKKMGSLEYVGRERGGEYYNELYECKNCQFTKKIKYPIDNGL